MQLGQRFLEVSFASVSMVLAVVISDAGMLAISELVFIHDV